MLLIPHLVLLIGSLVEREVLNLEGIILKKLEKFKFLLLEELFLERERLPIFIQQIKVMPNAL